MARYVSRRRGLLVAATVLASAGLFTSCGPGDTKAPAKVPSWSSVGLPHVVATNRGAHATASDATSSRTYAVEYRSGSLDLLGPDGHAYDRRVLSLAATRSAALVLLQDGSADPELLRLDPEGTHSRIGSHLVGIPLADTFGDVAVWAERPPGHRETTIRAYDLRKDVEVARTTTPLNALVTAIDGTAAYFVARGRPWRWDLSSGSSLHAVPGPASATPTGDLISASSTSGAKLWSLADRRTLLERPDGGTEPITPDSMFGLFDRSAAYVALAGAGRPVVREVATGEVVRLRLPAKADIRSFAWGLDGSLVVTAGTYEQPGTSTAYGCTAPSGRCTPFGPALSDGLSPRYVESSARGQLEAESPDWE